MVKKTKRTKIIQETEVYILPSSNEEMREFVKKFKVDMMENVVSKIKFALENKLPIVEVFAFKNSPFVVTINECEFDANLAHISQYFKEKEIFELCPKVEELRELLKRKINEKENPEDHNGPNPLTPQ